MKFFTYLCCIAHLLTEISARLRLTTPSPSLVHSIDDAARQASNIAEMIDFVNSVYNDDARSIARSGRYDAMLRRFELPAVNGIDLPAGAAIPNDEGTEKQLENIADAVRYQFIDNPDVLEEYSNKQKRKNNEELFNPVPVVFNHDTSTEAKSFNTVENKLRYYHSKSNSNASQKSKDSNNSDQLYLTPHTNPLDGIQELTTVESTYRPSFPDDDNDDDDNADDDKLVTEDKEVTVTEKEINTTTADEKNDGDLPKVNDTIKIEKRAMDIKASGKEYQARIDEEKAQMDDTKETGQIKHELLLMKDKKNDGVTVNEEKSESNKEHNTLSTKIYSNSIERPREANVRSRDEDYKNDGSKKMNVTTDTNNEKDKLIDRFSDANKIINVPVERLIGRINKSALRNKQTGNNHNHKEQHSIYSQKERNENRNKQFKNSHEYDRKKKDSDWNEIDKQRYSSDNGYAYTMDTMEYEWNKRHQQYDENDNWNKNDDFSGKYYDSNKRDDDWNKRDNDWNKRDNDWNKRDDDWNKRDDDWNKRDDDWNKKDNDWHKRDIHSIKKDRKTYKDGRNKKDWRKQNAREKKYSVLRVENDGSKPYGRFKIVERKRKFNDYKRAF